MWNHQDFGVTTKSRSQKTRNRQSSADAAFRELAGELSLESGVPLHRQISDHVRTCIEEGRLVPGQQLSSERRITELLRVSRPTVRAALASLIDASYVRAMHGCGCFVLEPPTRKEWRILALQNLAANPKTPPVLFNFVDAAEQKLPAKVHYIHVPAVEKLRETVLNPPDGYDGLYIFRAAPEWIQELLELERQGLDAKIPLPLMLVNRELPGSRFNFISADHENVGRQAARKLIEAGHRRIGYIGVRLDLDYSRLHFEGFQAALSEAGLSISPSDMIEFQTFDPNAMEAGLRPFLADPGFSAVVVGGSSLSAPFEQVVQGSALVVPRRLSAILITEQYVLDELAIRWTALIDPGSTVVERGIEALIGLGKSSLQAPVQELRPYIFQEGATCRSKDEDST